MVLLGKTKSPTKFNTQDAPAATLLLRRSCCDAPAATLLLHPNLDSVTGDEKDATIREELHAGKSGRCR
jgi:hypothetical protein